MSAAFGGVFCDGLRHGALDENSVHRSVVECI